jgi:hypothetical protein
LSVVCHQPPTLHLHFSSISILTCLLLFLSLPTFLPSQLRKTHHVTCQNRNACRQFQMQSTFQTNLSRPSANKLIPNKYRCIKPLMIC